MAQQTTRREILKGGLAVAGLGMLGIPEWAMPVLAQGETLVEFTDLPEKIVLVPTADRRIIDIRYIDGFYTPKDNFPTTQHYGHPMIDPAAFRLKVSGMVSKPLSLSLDDLKKMRSTDVVFGFECSGNRRPLQGLAGNGRWTGVSLKRVLDEAGVDDEAREFVSMADGSIQPPGDAIGGLSGNYIDGVATIGDRIVLILNLDHVIEAVPGVAA